MKKETGGPAFPQFPPMEHYTGMTLRDWFAGMAFQGLLNNLDDLAMKMNGDQLAEFAYGAADSMLKAREK